MRNRARQGRRWTRDWLQRRRQRSTFHTLVQELSCEDQMEFKNYFRMDKATFNMLLGKVEPLIIRQNTILREAISPDERLAGNHKFH